MAWISPYDPAVSSVAFGVEAPLALLQGALVLTAPFTAAPSYTVLVNPGLVVNAAYSYATGE